MVLVNDQHPFDVEPDDDRRPAADAAVPTPDPTDPVQRAAFERTAEDQAAEATEAEAHAARRKHRRIAAFRAV